MRTIRTSFATINAVVLFLSFSIAGQSSPLGAETREDPVKHSAEEQEFLEALKLVDAAQLELQRGNATAYKALWSHSADITLIGGFGGSIEQGWERVSQRLDWAAAQFSNGTNTIERLVARTNGQLGYLVQIERVRFQVPGQTKESVRNYRVTMLFRHEAEGWRIIHRHADSQMMKQAPQ